MLFHCDNRLPHNKLVKVQLRGLMSHFNSPIPHFNLLLSCHILYAALCSQSKEYRYIEYRYGLIVRNHSELQKMWVAQGFI